MTSSLSVLCVVSSVVIIDMWIRTSVWVSLERPLKVRDRLPSSLWVAAHKLMTAHFSGVSTFTTSFILSFHDLWKGKEDNGISQNYEPKLSDNNSYFPFSLLNGKKNGSLWIVQFGWPVFRAFSSSAFTCCWVSLCWKNWFDPVQCYPRLVRSAFVSSGSPADVQPAGKEPSGALWERGWREGR